jgi:hypothetical protein
MLVVGGLQETPIPGIQIWKQCPSCDGDCFINYDFSSYLEGLTERIDQEGKTPSSSSFVDIWSMSEFVPHDFRDVGSRVKEIREPTHERGDLDYANPSNWLGEVSSRIINRSDDVS